MHSLYKPITMVTLIALAPVATAWSQGSRAIVQDPVVITSSYAMPEYISASGDSLLEGYMDEALQESPALKAAFEDWLAAGTLGDQLDRLPDPEIMFSYYLNPAAYDGVIAQAALGMMQLFPWPGTRAADRQYADVLARARWEALEGTRIALQEQVKRSWFTLLQASRQEGYLAEHLQWVERLEDLTASRFENGYASRSDLLLLEMERLEITAEIQAARARFQGAQSDFNALLGRPSDLEVQLPEGRTDLQPDTGLMQAEETDWTGHPEVLRQTLLGEAGELAVERARLAGRPMLGVGAEIMGSNYLMGMTGRVPVVASVRLQLPVWRKPVRARIEQARAETRSTAHRRDAVQQRLRSDHAAALSAYGEAHARVELYRTELVPRSRELTDLVLLDYSGGRTDLDQVIASRRRSVTYVIALETALRDRNIAATQLNSLFETSSTYENLPE